MEFDPSERMPVRASVDKIRQHWLTALCALDLLWGLVTIFGRTDSASWVVLRQVCPPAAWGCFFIVATVAIWFGWSVPGGIAGTVGWGALTTASLASIASGTALSWGGPVLFGFFAAVHVLITYEVSSELDSERERRQRG